MQELIDAIRDRKVLLFVGSGVSQNLGLPSFEQLIDHLADELGYDPDIFRLFGDYLSLAEYYRLQKRSVGPLRSWMDTTWHSAIDIRQSRVHKLIVDLRCPIIYTTNYDRWLERAHEYYKILYKKIVTVGDIPNISENVVQIIKFHGDFDDDDSIVLTESSYFDRLNFESPLDIKLKADALGKTILFIGYSLTDINIRYLIYRLHKQWETSPYFRVRPKSYIFLTRPNPVQETILEERGIRAFVSEKDDPGEGLVHFLEQIVQDTFGKTGPNVNL